MSVRAALIAALASAVVAGCVVSSFDKVDDVGTGGTGGTGGQGGQSGAGVVCAETCNDGPNGEPACCFFRPGNEDNECGYDVAEYGDHCLAPYETAAQPDASCPSSGSRQGCCLSTGLCGILDTAHSLGCVPAEAFPGTTPTPCGSNPCGRYCIDAQSAGCDVVNGDNEFPVWQCSELCKDGPCTSDVRKVVDTCDSTGHCLGNGDAGYSVGSNDECRANLFDLAVCMQTKDNFGPDCTQYCELVTSVCTEGNRQYADYDDCLAVCWYVFDGSVLNRGDLTDSMRPNDLACRIHAVAGADSNGKSASEWCPSAGPGGGSLSGSKCAAGFCDSYCRVFESVCGTEFTSNYGDYDNCFGNCTDADFRRSDVESGDLCRFNRILDAIADASNALTLCADAKLGSAKCGN
ncbi:MAG: hypothetical protein R3B13_38160 [Polyangiaceae bacterium]